MSALRETLQPTLPMNNMAGNPGEYNIYPVHKLEDGLISDSLSELARIISESGTVMIDGYNGADFNMFIQLLSAETEKLGCTHSLINIQEALKPEAEIDAMIAPFLGGDDPIFGYRTTLELSDFFDSDRLFNISMASRGGPVIIYGTGAALAGSDGLLVYIDIPKNEIQYRARAGSVKNIGASEPFPPRVMYKRSYFVDWVVLNRHKKSILGRTDIFLDGQREDKYTWIRGNDLRQGLSLLAHNGFRVRPWFEPGPWGGKWIREKISALPGEVSSYAWSFELIVPENGVIFSSSSLLLEVSFDMIMYMDGKSVVGDSCYREYGDEFPIRMDYLDTFDGGNLSVQCHPHREYIQKNFGEVLTQEETYYILDNGEGSVVYLGFREDIDPAAFRQALEESYMQKKELEVKEYVNALPSSKHDLFLIPPGTLHSSGRNNLVLEISTTPYIYTFKMYDWLSLDLDGKPRPLNIERAMENLCFDRRGERIRSEFISKPSLLDRGDGWELYHLPTHECHSYDVHRLTLLSSVNTMTEGRCHVLNLVEGTFVEIETASGMRHTLSYGETFVVSAAAESYTLHNTSGQRAMLVKAFMKQV